MGSGEGSAVGSGEGSVVGSGEGSVVGSGEVSGVGSGAIPSSSTVASPPLQLTNPDDTMYQLCHLNHDQLRILWHQHLDHLHSCYMSDLHKYA